METDEIPQSILPLYGNKSASLLPQKCTKNPELYYLKTIDLVLILARDGTQGIKKAGSPWN